MVVLIFSATMTACGTTQTTPDLPCPLRPEIVPIAPEMQAEVPPYVLEIVAENYIRFVQYAKQLEVRAGCEDR